MPLDKIDEKLINELIENSKTPLRSIASKLKVSSVTVMNRIKRLEKDGVISGYAAHIDHEKTGHGVHALIELRIAKGRLFEMEKKIARSPNIYAVYDTTGGFDTLLLGKFKTTRSLDTFLKKIQTYDFVVRTNTRLILNTIKQTQVTL